METKILKNRSKRNFEMVQTAYLICSVLIPLTLIGCATGTNRNQSAQSILARERTLIEKIKEERAQAEVRTTIEQNPELLRAENHLTVSLDEILKANEVISKKLLKKSKKEETDERNEN